MKTAAFCMAALALLAYGAWVSWNHLDPTVPVPGDVPRDSHEGASHSLQTQVDRIEAIGFVEPISEVRRLSFKAGGIISKLHVSVGSDVKQGSRLAELSNTEAVLAVAVAEEELKLAIAEEARVLRGTHVKRIEAARAKSEATASRISYLKKEVDRLQSLPAQAVSRSDLDRVLADLQFAHAEHDAALAEALHLETSVLPEDKTIAHQRVRLAEAKTKQLREKVSDTELLAPFDGTVLELLKREGEAVTIDGHEPIILFADMSRRRIRAEIDERHIHNLAVGMPATIYGRNIGEATYSGRIETIKAIMGDKTIFARTATERKDLDALQVLIGVDECHLPAGLRVDVSIIVNNMMRKETARGPVIGSTNEPSGGRDLPSSTWPAPPEDNLRRPLD